MARPKIISEKVGYDKDWLKIIEAKMEFSDGSTADWTYICSRDAVGIIALDKDMNVFLVKEYKVAWNKKILQIPFGEAKGTGEKQLLLQARNEMKEEIGLDAKRIEKIGTLLRDGRVRGKFHIYLARDLFPSKKKGDEHEYVRVIKMPFKKACEIFLRQRVDVTQTSLVGLILARERLESLGLKS